MSTTFTTGGGPLRTLAPVPYYSELVTSAEALRGLDRSRSIARFETARRVLSLIRAEECGSSREELQAKIAAGYPTTGGIDVAEAEAEAYETLREEASAMIELARRPESPLAKMIRARG